MNAARAGLVLTFDGGLVVLSGRPQDVFEYMETIRSIDLGIPTVLFLLLRLKAAELDVGTTLDIDDFIGWVSAIRSA